MAKKRTAKDALKAWRESEEAFRRAVEAHLPKGNDPAKLSKDTAVALTKSRGKADRRMQQYLKSAL